MKLSTNVDLEAIV